MITERNTERWISQKKMIATVTRSNKLFSGHRVAYVQNEDFYEEIC